MSEKKDEKPEALPSLDRFLVAGRRALTCGGVGILSGVSLALLKGHSPAFYGTAMGVNFALAGGTVLGARELVYKYRPKEDVVTDMAGGALGGGVLGALWDGIRGAIRGSVYMSGIALGVSIWHTEQARKKAWEARKSADPVLIPIIQPTMENVEEVQGKRKKRSGPQYVQGWWELDSVSDEKVLNVELERPWPDWLPIQKLADYPQLDLSNFEARRLRIHETTGLAHMLDVRRLSPEELEKRIEERNQELVAEYMKGQQQVPKEPSQQERLEHDTEDNATPRGAIS